MHCEKQWQVFHVRNASEAIDYLAGFYDFADRTRFPLPEILLLSLNAATTSSLDLLAWLRGNREFLHRPVVVASAAGAGTHEVSAFERAPWAWFVRMTGYHEVLNLCERLLSNAWLWARNTSRAQQPATLCLSNTALG
jgi:hypothetical protein